ncbi:BatA and WFA domain-containing protein [Pedobacter sp. SD-b]|uniref:BatA and WFA domain-containing protein n=1 Tax=Pedobacter segetis TaxID=2793069 RepID=A0ABS1BKU6_9SPHI|nr:BatA domain-containing protein [Pedobacter segetis]MBK0383507.1 BatA and WFA domain-containing protein [Pedobacter segetis]
MGFLFPEFLFALLLIAIPVIIHLFNFRKFKKVYFTNVRFLKDAQLQTSSTQKLKERLILLSRVLAIIFLVLAFAQPFLKNSNTKSIYKNSVVSIYIDNSYSMEAVNKNGTLLDEAKRNAIELVNAYSLNDKFQLLTNDFSGKQQRLINKEELLDELNDIKTSPVFRNYQAVIDRQQNFLASQQQVKKVAYLISDFQKQNQEILRKDTAINFYLIPLLANDLPNLSVDTVYFLSPFHQPKQKENLVYKVTNHSDKEVENIPIKLTINGLQKAIASLSIKPNASKTDTLEFSNPSAGWQNAKLSVKDYPIVFDDNLNFTFEVKSKLPVLAIFDKQPLQNIKIAYQTDAFFDFNEVDLSQINYSGLANQQFVILENLKTISSGLTQQLKQFVDNGASLSVFIPLDADLPSYQTFFRSLATDYPTALIDRKIQSKKLDLSSPVFTDIFEKTPKNIDLPFASKYFSSSSLVKTTKEVLMEGEGNVPLLDVFKTGKGKVYISFIPIEKEASNLSQHALFLPILFKMALLSAKGQKLFYTIGKNQEVEIPSLNIPENENILIKNKDLEVIPEMIKKPSETLLYFADQLNKQGIYDVYLKDSLLAQFALNEDRKESDLKFYNRADLSDIFSLKDENILKSNDQALSKQIEVANFGTSLWKLCIILTILFLLMEVLLIRFFKNNNIKHRNLK